MQNHTHRQLAWCRRLQKRTHSGFGMLTTSSADRMSTGPPGTHEPAGPFQPLLQGTDTAAEPADPDQPLLQGTDTAAEPAGPDQPLLQGPPGTGIATPGTGTEAGAGPGQGAPDTGTGTAATADQGPETPDRGLAGRGREVLAVPGTGRAGGPPPGSPNARHPHTTSRSGRPQETVFSKAADPASVIPGYGELSKPEQLKARMRLQLGTQEQVRPAKPNLQSRACTPLACANKPGCQTGAEDGDRQWTRFQFNKVCPVSAASTGCHP